jgi:hypothetical protein
MKTLYMGIACVFLSLQITGCVSTPNGEKFSKLLEPRNTESLIYLYRQNENYGKALTFTVFVDDQEKGNIGNDAYMIIPVPEGTHTIRVKGFGYADSPISINVKNNTVNLLKIYTEKGFMGFTAELKLKALPSRMASNELRNLSREPERFIDSEI